MRIHVHNLVGGTLPPVAMADFGDRADHVVTIGDSLPAFRAVAAEVEVLLCATHGVRDLLPFDAPRLRAVSCMSAGLESLAPYEWLPPGVALLNNSGVHAAKAAEYALMALLMLANRVPTLMRDQQARRWAPTRPATIAGKRLTILGFGVIGQRCGVAAGQMGMRVTGVRRRAGPAVDGIPVAGLADLAALLPGSDYLLLTLPLTAASAGMVDGAMLDRLPRGAGIVNIGRGGVLDEAAVLARLHDGRLGGAVLDVFETEPLAPDAAIWNAPGLMVTPHMSSDDPESHNRLTVGILLDNLPALAAGRAMPNAFDTVAGTRQVAS